MQQLNDLEQASVQPAAALPGMLGTRAAAPAQT